MGGIRGHEQRGGGGFNNRPDQLPIVVVASRTWEELQVGSEGNVRELGFLLNH